MLSTAFFPGGARRPSAPVARGHQELANQMHDFGTILVCTPISGDRLTYLSFMHVLLQHRRKPFDLFSHSVAFVIAREA